MTDTDVAVVGAGLAGLATARLLREAGVECVVLEARDRVGGRTLSRRVGEGVFDLGGQWIGPGQERLAALVRALGVETFPTFHEGTKVLDLDGEITTYESDIPSVSVVDLVQLQAALGVLAGMQRLVPPGAPHQAPVARGLDARTVEDLKRSLLRTRGVRGLLDAAVRTIFGAEPSELSLLHFLFYMSAGGGLLRLSEIRGGAQQDRFVPGAQAICARVADELGDRVRLSSPVRSITQDEGGVTVRLEGGELRAARVVVALPPGLASAIDYSPRLPDAKARLLEGTPMGATVKVIALYDRAFWRERGLSGEVVCSGGPVTVAFDNTSHDGAQPALLGFVVGERARRWSERPAEERRAAVLDRFAAWYGEEARRPAEWVEQDWCAEPWTGGCPVAVMGPGTLSSVGHAMREPVGRIHWAGTETARQWHGYLEGALESAERVTRELA